MDSDIGNKFKWLYFWLLFLFLYVIPVSPLFLIPESWLKTTCCANCLRSRLCLNTNWKMWSTKCIFSVCSIKYETEKKNVFYCRQFNRRYRMEYEICGERLAQIREERKNSLPGECYTEWSWLQTIRLHTSSTINLYDEI